MKKNSVHLPWWRLLMCLLVTSLLFSQTLQAQKYAKMKITTSQGVVIEGKKGVLNQESAAMLVDGQQQSYSLADIQNVMAKKGLVWKWAACSGGGCLAIGIATTAVNPNNDEVGTLLLGSALWAGIFAGIGGLVGLALDPWKNVYVPSHAAFLKNLDLQIDRDYRGNLLLGVSYRF